MAFDIMLCYWYQKRAQNEVFPGALVAKVFLPINN